MEEDRYRLDVITAIATIVFFSAALKLVLYPASSLTKLSTHTQWLRHTKSQPPQRWFESAGQPDFKGATPLYTWLACAWSHAADLLHVNLESPAASVLFYRTSVVVSEVLLIAGAVMYCNSWPKLTTTEMHWSKAKVLVVMMLVLFEPALIMVDHVYIRLTGMAVGVLLISVALIKRGTPFGDVAGLATFNLAMLFELRFAWLAPLYWTYLVRHYCFQARGEGGGESASKGRATDSVAAEAYDSSDEDRSDPPAKRVSPRKFSLSTTEITVLPQEFIVMRFMRLVGVTVVIAAVVVAPLMQTWSDVLIEVKKLLVEGAPEYEMLSDAPWAPNVWALYRAVDKILVLLSESYADEQIYQQANVSGFTCDASSLVLLPEILPWVTKALTLVSFLPALVKVWQEPYPPVFLPALTYCMASYFMLNVEMNEEVVLMVVIPLALASCDSTMDAHVFLMFSWIGHIALTPLLSSAEVLVLKVLLITLHCLASYISLDQFHIMSRIERRIRPEPNGGGVFLYNSDSLFLHSLALFYIFVQVVYPVAGGVFVPENYNPSFVLTYLVVGACGFCAGGMVYCWYLIFVQLERKVTVIESYQWSPKPLASRKESEDPVLSLHSFDKYSGFR